MRDGSVDKSVAVDAGGIVVIRGGDWWARLGRGRR